MGDDLQLEHNQPNNKPHQSTITILTTVDAMGSTDVDQSITKWVLARVSVEVMSKQTARMAKVVKGTASTGYRIIPWVSIRVFVSAGYRRTQKSYPPCTVAICDLLDGEREVAIGNDQDY